ncbi:hypothetical protein IMY05_006G0053500 [Salix suchowensis]|nr:hypothetical protein IMY05_006G0053500 [Salix suchowensis]
MKINTVVVHGNPRKPRLKYVQIQQFIERETTKYINFNQREKVQKSCATTHRPFSSISTTILLRSGNRLKGISF